MSAEKPLVSVSIITYNQEAYIAEAIESVLCQKTSFPFELVIGEDCSTDRTPEIVESYRARYPHIIRVLPNEGRLGASKNGVRTFMACRGDYIAFLDGDDYWTCEEKLERQVEIMKGDASLTGVFGQTQIVTRDGKPTSRFTPDDNAPLYWGLRDLVSSQPYHPAALMVRNPRWTSWPDWLGDAYNLDWALPVEIAKSGPFYYLALPVAVYRVTGEGVWTGLPAIERLEGRLRTYTLAKRELPIRCLWAIRNQLQRDHLDACWCSYKAGAIAKAKHHYWQYLLNLRSIQLKHDLYVGLVLYAPRLVRAYYRLRGRQATDVLV